MTSPPVDVVVDTVDVVVGADVAVAVGVDVPPVVVVDVPVPVPRVIEVITAGPPGPKGTGVYAVTVGDGVNAVLQVSHPQGSTDVLVQCADVASGQTVWPVVLRVDAATVLLDFGDTVPAVGSIRVLIIR